MLNIFEFIERWGDYGTPIAMILIIHYQASQRSKASAAVQEGQAA